MCGIYGCLSSQVIPDVMYDKLEHALQTIKHRGPDDTRRFYDNHVFLGFHRLRINDLSDLGDQPFTACDDAIQSICNGEIYNHAELAIRHGVSSISRSDCEVIVRMYEQATKDCTTHTACHTALAAIVNELDGEFAGIIYNQDCDCIHAFRDHYGVRPLFYGFDNDNRIYFASEAKALAYTCTYIDQIKSGHIMTVTREFLFIQYTQYRLNLSLLSCMPMSLPQDFYIDTLRSLFTDAVKKRVMSERSVCALLSGGLDSSLVAALAAKELSSKGQQLHTYTIGLPGSPDVDYAKMVAAHINSNHHTIMCTPREFLDAIPEVIYAIESFDVTTVRASVGNYLVAKHISQTSNHKVVFNGDYADEVMSGYLYFQKAPSPREFQADTIRLIENIQYFDSLRSDRCISHHGLEARTPFSDKAFIEFYLRIPHEMRMPKHNDGIEKFLLRQAFCSILPQSVAWRKKEAFSDGVSAPENSWHSTIKAHTAINEADYYKHIFDQFFPVYPSKTNIIPYPWMPAWCGSSVTDPSAREIKDLY